METFLKIISWSVGIGVLALIIFSSGGGGSSNPSGGNYNRYTETDYDSYESEYENLHDLAYDNWDEVREYIDGSETVEACSDSGCYELDADISSGYIETVYFENGGYISPDAEIDNDGYASGYDSNGNPWDFTVSDSIIEEAVDAWIEEYRDSYEDYRSERDEYYR